MRQYPLVAVNECPLSGYERTSCGFATGQEKYRTRMEWPASNLAKKWAKNAPHCGSVSELTAAQIAKE